MKRVTAAILLAVFVAGCAASGSVQTLSRPPAIDSTKSGAVEVFTTLPGKADSAGALRAAIASQMVGKKVFNAVTNGSESDYLVRVNVTDVSEVGQGARILLGALAGQAGITATCEVYDRRQNTVIGSMVAQGKSSGGHIFAGTTQEAIDIAASQIVDYLLQNRRL